MYLVIKNLNLLGEYNFQESDTNTIPFDLEKKMELEFEIEMLFNALELKHLHA
ncbi:MAG: hypothetical protein M3512_08600 [Bacteroidota bacterium]|nr:hypothetical protein [Bacteroidota bacterium]